jgi:hypothetical protein
MKLYQYNGEKASTRLQYECSDLANLINTHDRKSQVLYHHNVGRVRPIAP